MSEFFMKNFVAFFVQSVNSSPSLDFYLINQLKTNLQPLAAQKPNSCYYPNFASFEHLLTLRNL